MKNIYALLIFCLFTSCYTYRSVADEKEIETNKNPRTRLQSSEMAMAANDNAAIAHVQKSQMQIANTEKIEMNSKPKQSIKLGIKDKLQPDKIYKIKVADKRYKIQVDQWESDSLVVHRVNKPEKKMKFHKNQIEEDAILEKHFSQPMSDIITVTIYAGIAALIASLVL